MRKVKGVILPHDFYHALGLRVHDENEFIHLTLLFEQVHQNNQVIRSKHVLSLGLVDKSFAFFHYSYKHCLKKCLQLIIALFQTIVYSFVQYLYCLRKCQFPLDDQYFLLVFPHTCGFLQMLNEELVLFMVLEGVRVFLDIN